MSLYDFPGFLACSVAVFVLASCIYRKHVRNLRLFLLAVALLIGGLVLQEIVGLFTPPMSMTMMMTPPTTPTQTPSALACLSTLGRWTIYASLPVFIVACIGGAGAYAQCSKCGYNLTGNESGTCPECGEHLSSDV